MINRRYLHGFGIAAALILSGLGVSPAHAQSSRPRVNADYLFHRGNVTLTLAAGGAAFTDFRQAQARTLGAGSVASPAFTRRVSAQTSTTGTAGLAVWLSPRTAIQLGMFYTPTRFRVINETPDADVPAFDNGDTVQFARLDIWNADVSLLLRPPVALGRVYPYAILGGGVVRYQAREDDAGLPPEARAAFAGNKARTQWSAVVGAGAVIPLQRKRLLLTFDLLDHLARTPLTESRSTTAFEVGGTTVVLSPAVETSGSDGIVLTSHVRLVVGVTIPLRLQ
ncbi:MAG: hypothetical protein ABIV28_03525 [Longimicrobiales bacterium]